MLKKFIDTLIGEPLPNENSSSEKYNVVFGLAVMSSDAISSVAYASEEILKVLLPVIGFASFAWLSKISLMIIGLLFILVTSYRQIIGAYPNGGGSYRVASENLGRLPGLFAAAALLIDYVLTVAVSSSSAIAALISAFPSIYDYKVEIIICSVLILMILNLRGIRESSRIFSIPTYIFLLSMAIMIIYGFAQIAMGVHPKPVKEAAQILNNLHGTAKAVSIFLILKAFSSGCSALTGLEAVSDGVPNFKAPAQKNAKIVLTLLGAIVLFIFGGSALLANYYHAVYIPSGNPTVLSQIAQGVFGKGFMFYIIQFSTALILMMACNTAYTDFPMLMYIIGKDGYSPRQFTIRGQRLSFSTGIVSLSVIACFLVLFFHGSVTRLIPLYSVGVFLSFTLSQSGMVNHWRKSKEKGWQRKMVINGTGAIITVITALIIGSEKFKDGAWIVIFLIPILVLIMTKIKKHYMYVADHLRSEQGDIAELNNYTQFTHHFVVPISSLTKPTILALQYARSITPNVIALNISTDEEQMYKLQEKWKQLDTDIMLITKYSKYRAVITPLLKYIGDIARAAGPTEKVTVLLPEFVTHKWWGKLLHNHTSFFLREKILNNDNLTIATFPFHFDEKEEQ